MTAELGLTHWARLLVDSLIAAGICRAVLSPGSRSTPFAWALLERSEIECQSVLDERSAGFVALGQARITGRPSLLVSTSGSAPTHYYPSVVEAASSRTPLVVLTADRPWELLECGALQTTDQVRLYGTHTRSYVELGLPDDSQAARRGLRRRVVQAVLRSLWPTPGPVQLNARARKPLEPELGPVPPCEAPGAPRDPEPTQVFLPKLMPDPGAITELARECQKAQRGLIVCGAALPWRAIAPDALVRLARATGFAVLAEAASQQRFAALGADPILIWDGFEPLLRSARFRRSFRPDCVLHLGAPLLSSGWERWISEAPDTRRHAVDASEWPDAENGLTSLLIADPTLAAQDLASELEASAPSPAAPSWRDSLARANALGWQAVDACLGAGWSEGLAVRTVMEALPSGSVLGLGSSLPVREVDLYVPARPAELVVWSQRGLSGIDGLVSGAVGAALASRRPTVLLAGDLSFLHDVGGLWAARELTVPLVVVVLNNRGGRIFEHLPLAQSHALAEHFDRHWVLSHKLDLARIASAYGLSAERLTEPSGLAVALRRALARPACSVLEVLVPSESSSRLLASVIARVDQELAVAEGLPSPASLA
jgi:2-succinyl-5-enolpyruvyl-6-hydroxy-3-cyclohexene-1-carboxylate synthase